MNERDAPGFWTRYWLSIAIAATVVAAWMWPAAGRALPGFHVIDIGVAVVMFLGALKLAPDKFLHAARSPGLLVVAALMTFVTAPLVSLGLAHGFGLSGPEERLAVLICSAQASTLATAIVLTEVAGGDVALAMVITMVNNLLSIVATPVLFSLLGGADVELDSLAMARELALKVGAPVVVGQIARVWLAPFARKHGKKMSIASQLIILTYIFAGVGSALERLGGLRAVVLTVLGFAVVFHLVQLLLSALAARVATADPKKRVAIVMCSAQKTLPAAILIWKSQFLALPLGPLVAVGYHLVQLVLDSVLAPGLLARPLVRSSNGPNRNGNRNRTARKEDGSQRH